MAQANREWLDNAFWHNANVKDKAEAILNITDEKGRKIKQQLTVRKLDEKGNPNPDFEELVSALTIEKIDQNTEERRIKKEKEKQQEVERRKSKERAKELEVLFSKKIKVMEMDEVINSENRELKSKIRRSKNSAELNMWTMVLMLEAHGYELKRKNDEVEE